MPAFAAYDALITALISNVTDTFPEIKKVHPGWPVIPPKVYPYAVIALPEEEPMRHAQGGNLGYFQEVILTITMRFPMPSPSEGIQRKQVAQANTLIAVLEASSTYPAAAPVVQDVLAGVGPLPSPMTDENKNQFYEVNVMFACRARELHTSRQ